MKKYVLIAFYFVGSQALECADQNPRPVVPAPAPVAPFVLPANSPSGTWDSKSKAKRAETARKQAAKEAAKEAERQHKQIHDIRKSSL